MACARAAVKQERVFQNTFAPACENRDLGVGEIIVGLSFGAIKYRALPPEVRKAVDEEMRSRVSGREASPHVDDSRRRVEMLGAAQDLMRQGPERGAPGPVGSPIGKSDPIAERAGRKASVEGSAMARGDSCRM